MKIYLVGGAVRDKLLGLSVKERDWVVVEATPEDMLAQGYRQVGKEFPVFLHPKTNEEYALARMERKVKPGYKGFTFDTSPTVSLEDDLERRDLTINAMAESNEGKLIDPYHGKQDLDQKILRHVSPAFAEDPVRILRVGRFLARYDHLGFKVAPETINLMKQMVHAGEVDALVAERVWKELERALSEKNPEKFFLVLDECNALPRLFPGLDMNGRGIKALKEAAKQESTSVVRFAVLFHDAPNANHFISKLCDRYRAPNEYRDLAQLIAAHYKTALKLAQEAPAPTDETAEKFLSLFYALDIFRREARFKHFVIALESIAKAKDISFAPAQLLALAHAAKSYPVQELLNAGLNGPQLANTLKEKRREKIAQLLL